MQGLPQAAIGHVLVQNHQIGVVVPIAEQPDSVLVPGLAEEAHFSGSVGTEISIIVVIAGRDLTSGQTRFELAHRTPPESH